MEKGRRILTFSWLNYYVLNLCHSERYYTSFPWSPCYYIAYKISQRSRILLPTALLRKVFTGTNCMSWGKIYSYRHHFIIACSVLSTVNTYIQASSKWEKFRTVNPLLVLDGIGNEQRIVHPLEVFPTAEPIIKKKNISLEFRRHLLKQNKKQETQNGG